MKLTLTHEEYLYSLNSHKVDKVFCKEWYGAKNSEGYGTTTYKGKIIYAHRLAWIKKNGDIPKGMYICHKCDNPSCYNINHLFLGTPKDNCQDKVKKGRNQNGYNYKNIKDNLFYFN